MIATTVNANALRLPFADGIAQTCVTSPPYYGLRDYGHADQIGLEKTYTQYVANIVAVMREVWRVLKDDGTLWLNLGDSYATNGAKTTGRNDGDNEYRERTMGRPGTRHIYAAEQVATRVSLSTGAKPKDLLGIPWRVAFALQNDGWYLRSDIIWSKPNPMPESVTDRPTKAHEYVFLLAKQERYYYDADSISEPLKPESIVRNQTGWNGNEQRGYISGHQNHMSKYLGSDAAKESTTRNRRTVWTVATRPYSGAHFATFPPDLIRPMVLAGSRPGDFVLDPFSGAGTTAKVATELGRQFVGTEINRDYLSLATERTMTTIGMF